MINRTFNITTDDPQVIRLEKSGRYEVVLKTEGAEVEVVGGWHTKGNERIEIELILRHQAKHTRSNTVLRGVAQDASHLSLKGIIVVEPGAQDTNAFLTENVLLLNDKATAEAIPNLEISANEVKCSHAATVATISEEQLFYLQSRGIPPTTAQELIVEGFLSFINL